MLLFLTGLFIISCQSKQRKEKIREHTILQSAQSDNIPYDSVYVKKVNEQQDSLIFYKNRENVGSAVIVY